ncbi:hypothetical protein ACWDZ6_16440 [Streptomyces sp. NPDC002926]
MLPALGIGRNRLRQVPALPGDSEAVDVAALDAAPAEPDDRPGDCHGERGHREHMADFDDLSAIAALIVASARRPPGGAGSGAPRIGYFSYELCLSDTVCECC